MAVIKITKGQIWELGIGRGGKQFVVVRNNPKENMVWIKESNMNIEVQRGVPRSEFIHGTLITS